MKNWQRLKDGRLDKAIFIRRAEIIRAIRDFFWRKGFLEVETPEAVGFPGQEPHLEILDTEIQDDRGKKFSASLITSPEYAMKKMLAAGFKNIFQICKAFRNNESFGGAHNPEFTILEWYRQNADYTDIMKDAEELFLHILSALDLPKKIEYQGETIDFSVPWKRISAAEAIMKYAGAVDLSYAALVAAAEARGHKISDGEAYESVFFKVFLNEVEPKLDSGRPVIIYDYPAELGALARRKSDSPQIAERFEIYAGGLELANAFSELLDADEQKTRFLEEQKIRQTEGRKVYPLDEDFLEALRSGIAPSGGIALGIDRLAMLLTNQADINNVLLFPAKEMLE